VLMGKKDHNRVARQVNNETALLSAQTEVRGDIHFRGAMHVDGRVVGDVLSDDGELTLAESGTIEGNIKVPSVIINGRVCGDVSVVEKLEISSMAVISGTVSYRLLEIEVGAQINGNLECLSDRVEDSRVLEPPTLTHEEGARD